MLKKPIVSMASAVAVACAVILTSSAMAGGGACEPHWDNTIGQPGMSDSDFPPGSVRALTVFDDGSGGGPALYAGGGFTTAGGVAANRIAKWDGTAWSPLGDGLSGTDGCCPTVWALTVFDDGSGGGPALYAGGAFTTAGGVSANYIAKWDGTAWSALGSGMSDPSGGSGGAVRALTVFDDGSGGGPALYAGSTFTTAGGVRCNHIAKWDGTAWSAVGSGMSGSVAAGVFALAVFDDGSGGGQALCAGGRFTEAGGVSAHHIAKWDGTAWSALGSGMSGKLPFVDALTVFDDGSGVGPALFASGVFDTAGDVPANYIAKWDGTAWSALGSGLSSTARALTVFDDGSGGGPALYAGGGFDTAGGVPVNNIAKWDGTTWSPLGSGMQCQSIACESGSVWALTVFDDGSGGEPALYAGGLFDTAGGVPASNIAKWQGCPPECGLGDVNCDGAVDVDDLVAVILGWGACADCPPPNCPADVNDDCAVDVDDLITVILNWGL